MPLHFVQLALAIGNAEPHGSRKPRRPLNLETVAPGGRETRKPNQNLICEDIVPEQNKFKSDDQARVVAAA